MQLVSKVSRFLLTKFYLTKLLPRVFWPETQAFEVCTANRGGFAQSLNFKYLYKSHCKSCELLWLLRDILLYKTPQQFVGFAVTFEKIFKV